MTFSIAEQIAYVSRRVKLRPGDMFMSGTPGGVGKARGQYLQPGNVVEIEITNVGVLRTGYVANTSRVISGAMAEASYTDGAHPEGVRLE